MSVKLLWALQPAILERESSKGLSALGETNFVRSISNLQRFPKPLS